MSSYKISSYKLSFYISDIFLESINDFQALYYLFYQEQFFFLYKDMQRTIFCLFETRTYRGQDMLRTIFFFRNEDMQRTGHAEDIRRTKLKENIPDQKRTGHAEDKKKLYT